MPGYNSRVRRQPASHRAKKLVETARELVDSRWSGRSWTEVGYSVVGAAVVVLQWTAGIVLKVAINVSSAGLFGALGSRILARAEASGYGPGSMGQKISDSAVEYIWPLIEDVVKGEVEERAIGVASRTEQSQSALKKLDVLELAGRIKTTASELLLRSSALDNAMQTGRATYCDHVYYMALEMYQIQALRGEVINMSRALSSRLGRLEQLARDIDVRALKRGVRRIADTAVEDGAMPHYTAYGWNLLYRRGQCSEAHCYGPAAK